MISSEDETRGHKELQKLQLMLRNLEEYNDLPSPEKAELSESIDSYTPNEESIENSNGIVPANTGLNSLSDDLENGNLSIIKSNDYRESMLENDPDILNIEEDFSMDDEESWLLESPMKSSKKPLVWLSQNVKTPELERVRGKLASKLDLISIQNRKEKLSQLLWKHNLGSHPESAPGRLYQAESMCSVMSLDWEYDEDELCLAFSSPIHRPATASDYYQMTDFDEIDSKQVNHGKGRLGSAFTDSPKHNRFMLGTDERKADFDDLQPMTLDFESSPVIRRSVQVAPGPVITRRGGPGKKRSPDEVENPDELIVKPTGSIRPRRSKPDYERSDSFESGSRNLSDRSDSSGDLQLSPRGSMNSSRSSLTSNDDLGQKTSRSKSKGKTASSNKSYIKPRAPSANLNPDDEGLVVKLPASSQDGPVIRRRGAASRSYSNDNILKKKDAHGNYGNDSEIISASPVIKNNSLRPRTAAPIAKRGMPKPRGYNQSADILPRRGKSPEPRCKSPDAIQRRSGVVPRGQVSFSNKF